jgi:hypothetical protein
MQIAIPSKGRGGTTSSQKVLPAAVFYVPAGEVHTYRTTCKNIVAVPNDVKGITSTRNWILKNSDSPRIVFIDDDVVVAGYTKLYKEKGKQKTLRNEESWIVEFQKLFDITEQMGWKIWGLKTESALRSVYPYKPFNFRSYVTASCMGIINDGSMYFDEDFPVKEDYEICLRHVKKYGGIFAARHLHWQNKHWETEGGCKNYRTQTMEAECIKKLVEKYPGMVRQIIRGGCDFSIELNF